MSAAKPPQNDWAETDARDSVIVVIDGPVEHINRPRRPEILLEPPPFQRPAPPGKPKRDDDKPAEQS